MDFENPKNWEALKREAEKAIDSARLEMYWLETESEDYQRLQKDITQYEIAITIANLALKIAAAD